MKIAQSNVAMEGSSSRNLYYQVSERLELTSTGRAQAPAEAPAAQQATEAEEGVLVDLSSEQEKAAQQAIATATQQAPRLRRTGPSDLGITDENSLKLRLLEMMLYHMTGKRMKLFDQSAYGTRQDSSMHISDWIGSFFRGGSGLSTFGMEYDYQETRIETEQVAFKANGAVRTEDGRTITFDVEMMMERAEMEQKSFSLRIGSAAQQHQQVCDPLVIAYGGGTPELSGERHAFDLTMDGNDEQITFAVNGSGFLALDKNGDGTINDGGELFGPQSGNGFSELALYDMDGNGWIDENDPVFSQLRVLTLNEDGERVLFSLGELGVGAIYLNNVETQYNMKEGADTQGVMRSSSVFLKENGEAGTIHHIDLTI